MYYRIALGFFFYFVDELSDPLGSSITARHFDQQRIFQETAGQLFDLWRKSRREHQVLTLLGQEIDDALQIRQEAHIEHTIGFVHHKNLGL